MLVIKMLNSFNVDNMDHVEKKVHQGKLILIRIIIYYAVNE